MICISYIGEGCGLLSHGSRHMYQLVMFVCSIGTVVPWTF